MDRRLMDEVANREEVDGGGRYVLQRIQDGVDWLHCAVGKVAA